MALDTRNPDIPIMFVGDGPRLQPPTIEIGDEATLHFRGAQLFAKIKSTASGRYTGEITKPEYGPNIPAEYAVGEIVGFSETEIFGILQGPVRG